jgi:hypothetical protein
MYIHLTARNIDNFKLLRKIKGSKGKYWNVFEKKNHEVWIKINCFWRGYFRRLLCIFGDYEMFVICWTYE